LNDAEKEADLCAAKYPQREILKGSDATKQRVLRSMQESDVAHLALHCVIDEDSPGWTALVLADSKTTEGSSTQDQLLHINEIYGIDLPRTRFVVLSACHTALGQYYRGEGIVSLARPFLALGVPTVVASLWEVDSRATADLMIKLHEVRRQSSVGAGEALQAAQLAVLKNQPFRHPYYWAAFIAVGSNS
jgi:CHAT domain-containing protein